MANQEENGGGPTIESILQKTLLGGVVCATVLFVFGIAGLLAGSSQPNLNETESLGNIVKSAESFNPMGFIGLGVIIVVMTPLVRILMTVFYFFERDRLLAIVPIVVMALIVISFILKTRAG